MAEAIARDTHVVVNGEQRSAPGDGRLVALLVELGVDVDAPRGVAVAVNDAVIRRNDWKAARLADGDRVEVVTAKAGG